MLINQLGTAGFNWWDPFLLLNGTGLNTQVISTAGPRASTSRTARSATS